jgi:hypothetical protein
MKKYTLILASATFFFSGAGWAQQQYDSLGSPTRAPNQAVSPNAVNPTNQSRATRRPAGQKAKPLARQRVRREVLL